MVCEVQAPDPPPTMEQRGWNEVEGLRLRKSSVTLVPAPIALVPAPLVAVKSPPVAPPRASTAGRGEPQPVRDVARSAQPEPRQQCLAMSGECGG